MRVPTAGALKDSKVNPPTKTKKHVSFTHKNKFEELENGMEVDNEEEEGYNMLQMVFHAAGLNTDAVQTEEEGSNSKKTIKNAEPQSNSVKNVSPEEIPNGGIGNWEPLNGKGNLTEEECGTCGEGVAVKIQKLHELPSNEEVEAHNAAHVPYRSWCPHCVKGKAVASKHVKQKSKWE